MTDQGKLIPMTELLENMSREQKDIARRWCILNCWGWPDDLPLPESNAERYTEARRLMHKCVREIGIDRALTYWNSDEFDGSKVARRFKALE